MIIIEGDWNEEFFLEGFLNTEDIFNNYINNNKTLKEASSVGLLIYNSDYSSVSYHLGKFCSEDKQEIDIFKINNDEFLVHKNNTEIRMINFSKDGKLSKGYALSVRNPITSNKIYVSSMILKYEELPDISKFCESFNFDYFEHFQFHIQTVANNYEKLFYIVDVFTDMLSKRDKYMPYHMSNVALWCNKISDKLEVSERDHIILYVSALLHDIGKMFIPEDIINKPSKLTNEEYALVKEHPEKSESILKSILYGMSFFNEVPKIVRHHHEYFDGGGYPDSLVGKEIPYLSRILSLADGIDAMLSRRAYKEPMSVPEIVREISIKSGIQYDPIIADAAIEVIDEAKMFVDVNAMSHINFISNASLSFYIEDYDTLKSIPGNLIIKNKEAMFMFDTDRHIIEDVELSKVHKPTIGFFGSNDFYEFSCDISNKNYNSMKVHNLNFIPTDTYFSIYLLKTIKVISKNKSFDAELIKFGGDTSVIKFKNMSEIDLDKNIDDMVIVKFDEEILAETRIAEINCRIIKIFNSGNEYTGIFKYIEISSTQRDSILRFLFRKQLEHRKQLKNAK